MPRNLILVSGCPGVGKTTLARPLAKALAVPLIAKDDIKETLFDKLNGTPGDEGFSRQIGGAAMEVMWTLAGRCPDVMLEANFRPDSAYERGRILAMDANVIEVHCRCDRETIAYVLPLVLARREGREFEIMRLLRKHCPRLRPDALAAIDTAGLLDGLRDQIGELVTQLEADSGARIGDVMRFIKDSSLVMLDERYIELINTYTETAEPIVDPATDNAALRFMQCEAVELWGYRKYIEKMSPFATQQGIKGAEFNKVLVVVDDNEGRTNTFSYGKYFGVTDLSDTDRANIAAGKDSTIDRTRRLFYVCCSRALSDLVVVIFAEDAMQMRDAVLDKAFFEPDCIHVFD